METLLLPKFLLILIVTSVSSSSQNPSQSQDNSSKPENLIEWDNYNKWLKNESNTVKSNKGNDSHDPIVENSEKPIAVVLTENPVEPSVHSTFVNGAPDASNGTIVIIIEKEVILLPKEDRRDSWPEKYDNISHAKKDDVHKPSQDVDSSGGKPSAVDESTNATAKNNGTHAPLNKTAIVDESTHGNLGNHSEGHGNDTEDHKSSPRGHYILIGKNIDEDHPPIFNGNGTYNSKPGGNSTRENATVDSNNPNNNLPKIEHSYAGIRWYPVPTYKPLNADTNSTGQKPSVIDQSSNATEKHNGTYAPLNKTEIVDNSTLEHQDKDNPHMHSNNETSNSKPNGDSAHKNVTIDSNNGSNDPSRIIRWYPVPTYEPLHADTNSTGQKPSVIDQSSNATEKHNGTYAPLNKTEIVDNSTLEHQDKDNPHMHSNNETSNSKPSGDSAHKNVTIDSNNGSNDPSKIGRAPEIIRWYPVPTYEPLHADTNSTGQKPSVIDQSSNATEKHNGTYAPLNKTETVDNKTSEYQGAASDHAPIDKKDPHMHSSDIKSNLEPGSNSTQKNTTIDSDNDKNDPNKTEHSHRVIRWYPDVRIYEPLHTDANSTDGKPSVIVKSLNVTEKNNGTDAPLNTTEISVNRTSESGEEHASGHKNDSKDHNSSPKYVNAPIDKDNPYLYSKKEKSDSKSGHNSTENAAAVTSDNDKDALYETKNNNDTTTIPELNDPFDGNSSHTAQIYVID